MPLSRKDLEKIEAIVFKTCTDVALSAGRNYDWIEQRISAGETRIHNRFTDLEDQVQALKNRELAD